VATKLPEDFPGDKALMAAGITTREEVETLGDEDLLAVDGIGPKTLSEIRGYDWGGGGASTPQASAPPTQGRQPAPAAGAQPIAPPVKLGAERNKNGTATTTVDPK